MILNKASKNLVLKSAFTIGRFSSIPFSYISTSNIDFLLSDDKFLSLLKSINKDFFAKIIQKKLLHELSTKEKKTLLKYYFRLIGKNAPLNDASDIFLVRWTLGQSCKSSREHKKHKALSQDFYFQNYLKIVDDLQSFEGIRFKKNPLNPNFVYYLEIFISKNNILVDQDCDDFKNIALVDLFKIIMNSNVKIEKWNEFLRFLLKNFILLTDFYPSNLRLPDYSSLSKLNFPGFDSINVLLAPGPGERSSAAEVPSDSIEKTYASFNYRALPVELDSSIEEQVLAVSKLIINALAPVANNQEMQKIYRTISQVIFSKIEDSSISLMDVLSYVDLEKCFSQKNQNADFRFFNWFSGKMTNFDVVNLTDTDFEEIEQLFSADQSTESLPPGFGFVYSLIEDKRILFSHLIGFPGTQIFDRFNVSEWDFRQKMQEYVGNIEAMNSDCIFAEIDNFFPDHLSDVCRHEISTQYFISLQSGAFEIPGKIQIHLEDLIVSSDGKKMVLYSSSLKKKIIPLEMSARAGVMGQSSIYYFLKYFSRQEYWYVINPYFLGLDVMECTPRIVYENVIILPKTWNFRKNQQSIETIFNKLGENKRITVYDEGNNFFIDLSIDGSLSILDDFWKKLKRGEGLIIREFFPPAQELDKANLLISIIETNRKIDFAKLPIPLPPAFVSTDEWTYLKIYGIQINLIRALRLKIFDFLITEKIQCWFFIFFDDSDGYHIRLRLKPNDDDITFLKKIANLSDSIIASCHCRIKNESYRKEVTLYGGNIGVKLVESISSLDSLVAIIAHRKCVDYSQKIRIFFHISLEYLRLLDAPMKKPLAYSDEFKKTLKDQYACNSAKLIFQEAKKFLEKNSNQNYLSPLVPINIHDEKRILLNELIYEIKKQNITKNLEHFVSRFIHLLHNRIFYDQSRFHESYITSLAIKLNDKLQSIKNTSTAKL